MNIFFAIPENMAKAVEGLKEFEENLAPLPYKIIFMEPTKPLTEQVRDI
ncbi:MAG: hypothetical protein HY730_03335, partial [Candidatus Tectomicrobia bacterium]|nr:hypothetical protein [Candidatus Tectomicrobia bacterium]